MAMNQLTLGGHSTYKNKRFFVKCSILCVKGHPSLQVENLMLDLSLIEESEIKDLLRVPMSSIGGQQITGLAMSLFPLQTVSEPVDLFYKNLWTFYNIRIDKKIQFQDVTLEVLEKAKERGQKIHSILQSVFKAEFMQRFKKRILKSRGLIKIIPKNSVQKVSNQNDDATERKVFAFGGTDVYKSPNDTSKNPLGSYDNRSISSKTSGQANSINNVSSLKDIKIPTLTLAPKTPVSTNNVVTEGGTVANLSDQVMCFCGKHVSLIDPTKEMSLLCIHCKKRYHADCTKRSMQTKMCPFCHLRKMIPNRETKRVLFVGLLQKGRKRHEISFNLTQEDLSIQFKIQVRCFRIKQGCHNFILFPDSSTFYLKSINLKEFTPLHRQSSLKYRKDEPFYITSGLYLKENKLIVTEKHPSKETKDDRIMLQNHLLGIYVIEEKKNDWLVREYKDKCFTTFGESKEMLDICFSKGSIGDEISCEVIKIPLTCTLTTEKIKIPARGALCNHFQCFDLKNYLDLITNAMNPRWLCPLCRNPTYEFKLDIILFHILQLHKTNDKASEVIFLRTGEFKVFESEEKECESQIHNIFNLPIDSKFKRVPIESVDLVDVGRKIQRK